jgi:hypothetical protein
VPIYSVTVPALVDYPNHLARMHILASSSAELAEYYEVRWALYPNLAMDAIVPWLGQLVGLELAGKLFLSFTILATLGGVMALNAALFGRVRPWPLVAGLFIYNRPFLWGFLNFSFGIGLAFWALAAWIRIREWDFWKRFGCAATFSAAIMCCHLSAFGFYAVAMTCYELSRTYARDGASTVRDWGVTLGHLLVPVVLFKLFSPTAERGTMVFGTLAQFLEGKYRGLLWPVSNYSQLFDGVTLLIVGSVAGLGLATKRLYWHRYMRLPVLALLGVFLCLPDGLFGSGFADRRLVPGIALLLVASCDERLETSRARQIAYALLLSIFAARLAVLENVWLSSDRLYVSVLQAIDRVPRGTKLYAAAGYRLDETPPFPTPVMHIQAYAVIRKDAFTTNVFAQPNFPGQPIAYRQHYIALVRQALEKHPERLGPDWCDIADVYDYFLIVNPASLRASIPSAGLVALVDAPSVLLLERGAGRGSPIAGCVPRR